jgi:N-acetylglucosamine kinase-like BadF-type ATPase
VTADGLVLAVDGGGVKTDLALLDSSGRLLSFVRGGGSQPHYLGVEGCVEVIEGLLARAFADAGLGSLERPFASTAQLLLAGADLPEEMAALRVGFDRLAWSDRLVVGNDTEALLRAGTDRGWGVAVVCGTGINCLGLAPGEPGSAPREARFLSFGPISGDWGGGADVGMAALAAAVRGADGRGPHTALESAVPAQFGMSDPFEVAQAFHLGRLAVARLGELAPVVLGFCGEDPIATGIISRLGGEVAAFARAALRRAELRGTDPDVVLGGRLLRSLPADVIEEIARQIHEVAPMARVVVSPSEPIVGAALLGLDALGADGAAGARVRAELDAAVSGQSTAVADRLG